jgi:hypothetical protein
MLSIYLLMFVSLDIFVWAPETLLCTEYHSSESLTEAPDLVAGLWRPLYVEWRNYAINYVKRPIMPTMHMEGKDEPLFNFNF